MRKLFYSILVFFGVFINSPILAQSINHDESASILLERLHANVNSGVILLGHHNDLITGLNWKFNMDDKQYVLSDIKDVCGDYPSLFGVDLGSIEQIGFSFKRGNTFGHMVEAIKMHYRRGGIITVSAHMGNILTGGNAWDISNNKVVSKILNCSEVREKFYGILDLYASFFKSLKDDNGTLIPILFRPWHESNLDCFWWGGCNCSDKDYKLLWKLTYEYLVTVHNLNNLLWVYSPSNISNLIDFRRRYPGNKYVDVIGYEGYQYYYEAVDLHQSNKFFIRKVRNGLAFTERIAKRNNKIAAFTETGIAGNVNPTWWTDCLAKAIDGYKIAYVYIWGNQYKEPSKVYGPYKGSNDALDFKKFIENKTCYLLSNV